MTRRKIVASLLALTMLAVVAFSFLLLRRRVTRHRVLQPGRAAAPAAAPRRIPPVRQWSAVFRDLDPDDLASLLSSIEKSQPDLYAHWSLGYLHARALAEAGEEGAAAAKLEPFLKEGNSFRDLALYHRSSVAEGEEASRYRMELIREYPQATYRDEAIDDEADYLMSTGDPARLAAFASRIAPSADTARRRELSARIVEMLVAKDDLTDAFSRGVALLRGGTTDDASDRVVRALDRPELLARMTQEQWVLMADAFQQHRHFDRAAAVLQMAISRLPPPSARPAVQKKPATPASSATKATVRTKKRSASQSKKAGRTPAKKPQKAAPHPAPAPPRPSLDRDDLQFSLGRSWFGMEKFAEAQAAYIHGANATSDPKMKATFLFHASRAAQLQGNDALGERLMTAAISVPGRFPATTAALTQRIRTRAKQGRLREAAGDVVLLRRIAPNDKALAEGTLAWALALLGNGQHAAAAGALDSIPRKLLDPYGLAEVAYWRARALEAADPAASLRSYLEVLRSPVPTHFAYFARKRLDSPAMSARLSAELHLRESEADRLIAAKQFELARRVQTDRVLLSSRDHSTQLAKLGAIYRELPRYREVLELQPAPLPNFPLPATAAPSDLLIAMGLSDEATEEIDRRWGLQPERAALTRSLALNLGGASRESIFAIEVMMRSVPDDYHPDLLPVTVRKLLYPRYFYEYIEGDAKRFSADPALVLSIMREESRFNPRAKSQAAARGLLQFIITTARDIGHQIGLVDLSPEDLYDPRIIISLGAKYIGQLQAAFNGNYYRTAAAYNAGPKQVALWSRLTPAAGDDFFLSSVNFDETKDYVRKVMNSWERYREIYGDQQPRGGLRVVP